jgi:hypothetical protein
MDDDDIRMDDIRMDDDIRDGWMTTMMVISGDHPKSTWAIRSPRTTAPGLPQSLSQASRDELKRLGPFGRRLIQPQYREPPGTLGLSSRAAGTASAIGDTSTTLRSSHPSGVTMAEDGGQSPRR